MALTLARIATRQAMSLNFRHYLPIVSLTPKLGNYQRFQAVTTTTTPSDVHKHKHDKLWAAERYLSVGLLGVLPAAAVIPHPLMDYAVAFSLVIHVHWGVEAIVTDYVRPSIFGPIIPKISIALVYLLSSLTLGGLFMFNYTDVGISNAVRMLAKI